jgi:hypothetical protein
MAHFHHGDGMDFIPEGMDFITCVAAEGGFLRF